jgi:hypothetical protein
MTDAEDDPRPCQCHNAATVVPFHNGHCCFWPTTQTCHPEAVAEWERLMERQHGRKPVRMP